MSRKKTLTMRPLVTSVVINGDYVRNRKDGSVYFDIRRCAQDLAKELIACGALTQDGYKEPHNDSYRYRVYVYAGMKAPGLEGIDES